MKYLKIMRMILLCAGVVACGLLSSCDEDSPDTPELVDPSKPAAPEDKGEVSLELDIPENVGTGSVDTPITVNGDEPLTVTIKQKSRYSDPDGSTYECEPSATIAVKSKNDTLTAKDMQSLLSVSGGEAQTNTSGTSPRTTTTEQTFNIGGHEVKFDLSYQAYKYLNSQKQEIEMPYVKVNAARLGGTASEETSRNDRENKVTLVGLSVRPLTESRSVVVRDSTLYEVTAQFTVELQNVNTKTTGSNTVVISTSFIGLVETVTELPDPKFDLKHEWRPVSGTESLASPFVGRRGETLVVELLQTSSYTDSYGITTSCSPRAETRISVGNDTVRVENVAGLKKIAESPEEITKVENGATQVFGSEGQTITVEHKTETATINAGGEEIAMPYYEAGNVRLTDVALSERELVVIDNKQYEKYDVTLRFSQTACAKNAPEGQYGDESAEFKVGYTGLVELKLVDVEYIPGGEWEDPHHNLMLAYHPYVIRRRTYSNGEVLEDIFRDYGHPAWVKSGEYWGGKYYHDDEWMEIFPEEMTLIGDSILTKTTKIEFSNLSGQIDYECIRDKFTAGGDSFDFDSYHDSILYEGEFVNLDLDALGIDCKWPKDNRQSGWYFGYFLYSIDYVTGPWVNEGYWFSVNFDMCTDFYDQYLVIDGHRIDFSELRNFRRSHNITIEEYHNGDENGYTVRVDADFHYFGKNFKGTYICNLYTRGKFGKATKM